MKRCSKCGEIKPLDRYYKAAGTRDGLRGDCKDCFKARAAARYRANPEPVKQRAREWAQSNRERVAERARARRALPEVKRRERNGHLKRKFGITLDDYDRMLAAQGGGCAICASPAPDIGSLHVDHDPATGKVRGLLCFSCNNALGDFRDDERLLLAAVDYLPAPDELVDAVRARVAALTSKGAGERGCSR